MNWFNILNGGFLMSLGLLMSISSSANPFSKENSIIMAPPLQKPAIVPDVPLPAEDILPQPANETRPVNNGCLSRSQITVMKETLQSARSKAIKGNFKDAIDTFNEFAGGAWDAAAPDLLEKSPQVHAIKTHISKIDEIASGYVRNNTKYSKKQLRIKFIKEITELIKAIDRAGNCTT